MKTMAMVILKKSVVLLNTHQNVSPWYPDLQQWKNTQQDQKQNWTGQKACLNKEHTYSPKSLNQDQEQGSKLLHHANPHAQVEAWTIKKAEEAKISVPGS